MRYNSSLFAFAAKEPLSIVNETKERERPRLTRSFLHEYERSIQPITEALTINIYIKAMPCRKKYRYIAVIFRCLLTNAKLSAII